MIKYMIIENRLGIKVIDIDDYNLGELLRIHEFYEQRGFTIHVE